jgi:hypothetical protein
MRVHVTAALLLLSCCFTAALLLLYCCFTAALLLLCTCVRGVTVMSNELVASRRQRCEEKEGLG